MAADLHTHVRQQRSELEEELAQVEQTMLDALAGLQPPFNQFVMGQARQIQPLRRAAVVLTGGLGAPDRGDLRRQRIDLAAAQEVLSLALHIHMRLVGQAATDDQSRSILGSTILAGDFCFSRSAELAVRTGNATVVEIFAETLKRVSEGHLRRMFAPDSPPFDAEGELLEAGAHAAGVLAGLATPALAATRTLARAAAHVDSARPGAEDLDKTLTAHLTASQQARWLALLAWLRAPAG